MILFVKYAESRVANEKKNETVSIQPNRKIKTIVDMIFDDISNSDEVIEAQSKIKTALNRKFEKLKADHHEDEAFDELLWKICQTFANGEVKARLSIFNH